MTDHTDPPTPRPDPLPAGGGPDEMPAEIRSRLSVPPLDEVTRARLVHAALDAAPAERSQSRRVRWLAAAAALVAVVAVGIGVVARDSDAPQPTAGAPAADRSLDKGLAQELESGPRLLRRQLRWRPRTRPLDSEIADSSLGDLGEVGRASELRAAIKGVERRAAHGAVPGLVPGPRRRRGRAAWYPEGPARSQGEPATVYVISVPRYRQGRGRRRQRGLPHGSDDPALLRAA